jgi:dephospho-CoA kinase
MGESTMMKGRPIPCSVALTGGLASGKSTVAGILDARGIPVFDADVAVHELYRPGRKGALAVTELFGPAVLDAEGGVDRRELAELVLDDSEARSRLEAAIHPMVRRQVAAWLGSLGSEPIAVVEAALLVETGSYRDYDVLVVVWCEPEQQFERAIARGVPRERARLLLAAQTPLDRKRQLADVVVDNRGSLEDLEDEVNRAYSQIQRYCASSTADHRQ